MKVAILTNFMEFNAGYSLTGIVKDQITMLTRHGNEVHLYVNSKFNESESFLPETGVILHKTIPFAHLKDYSSKKAVSMEHQMIANTLCATLLKDQEENQYDVIFTHDFIFTGWFLPYGLGCMHAAKANPAICWLHWIHSVPSSGRDWWDAKDLGPNARIVYPNRTDAIRVAEQYKTFPKAVVSIPHIKDLRTWGDFGDDSNTIIDKVPGLMKADIVQILPASTDRLEAKRVDRVIQIFGKLKKMGINVCLVIANQWATGRGERGDIFKYNMIAEKNGLLIGEEFVFTSTLGDRFNNGLSKRCLRELFATSNLFVFPTREESFGLVVPEAALSTGCVLVLNKSLQMQLEISGMNAIYFDFGSFHHTFEIKDEDKYFADLALLILEELRVNSSIRSRTFMKIRYNMDRLYNNFYAPVITGLSSKL